MEPIVGIVTALAALGSLGSLAVLFKVRADNRKTLAEARKLEQEGVDLAYQRLLTLLDVTTKRLDECQEKLDKRTPETTGEPPSRATGRKQL